MVVTGRRQLIPRLLVAALGLAGLLAMHGLGPSHGAVSPEHGFASASTEAIAMAQVDPRGRSGDRPRAGEFGAAHGAAHGARIAVEAVVRPVSRIWNAAPVAAESAPAMAGSCVAVVGASLLLLVLTRLRARDRSFPSTGAPYPAHARGPLIRSPGRLQHLSLAQLCVRRT